jgi:hypothetical protein
MTEEQTRFGEAIIQLHKDKDGVLRWEDLDYYHHEVYPTTWTVHKQVEQCQLMQGLMQEFGLIEMLPDTIDKSRLTRKGYSFTTFKKLEKEQRLYSGAKFQTALKQKYWWAIALVSFISGYVLRSQLPQSNQESKQPTPTQTHNVQNTSDTSYLKSKK